MFAVMIAFDRDGRSISMYGQCNSDLESGLQLMFILEQFQQVSDKLILARHKNWDAVFEVLPLELPLKTETAIIRKCDSIDGTNPFGYRLSGSWRCKGQLCKHVFFC